MTSFMNRLSKAIISNFSTLNEESATAFLNEISLNKDLSKRIISWLAVSGIIPYSKTGSILELSRKFKEYKKMANMYELEDPILINSDTHGQLECSRWNRFHSIVCGDTERTIIWFNQIYHQMNENNREEEDQITIQNSTPSCIQQENEMSARERINRIFKFLLFENRQFSYAQGYDRFAFATFSIAVTVFVNKYRLPFLFAEMISFWLTKEFIKMSRIKTLMGDMNFCQIHFQELDLIFSKFAPKVMNSLFDSGNSSIHFVLRWEFLLFAEEHEKIDDILLIWDHLITKQRNPLVFQQFLNALDIAHVIQVTSEEGKTMMESLQQNKKWDILKIMKDSNAIYLNGKEKGDNDTFAKTNLPNQTFAGRIDFENNKVDENHRNGRTNGNNDPVSPLSVATAVVVSSFCSFLLYKRINK